MNDILVHATTGGGLLIEQDSVLLRLDPGQAYDLYKQMSVLLDSYARPQMLHPTLHRALEQVALWWLLSCGMLRGREEWYQSLSEEDKLHQLTQYSIEFVKGRHGDPED